MWRYFLILLSGILPAGADTVVSIAAASNLMHVLDPVTAAFEATHPGIKLQTSFGASGNLFAQISHDAPYDVFLSADLDYPRALVLVGKAEEKSLCIFAIGQLVLWSKHATLPPGDLGAALRNPLVRKIAIANPTTAPYGRAAKQALEQLGLWDFLVPKLVVGENISQTAQFVDSGNADLGLVALSVIQNTGLAQTGHWLAVPPSLHLPLMQGGILTTRGAAKSAAHAFLEFLQSTEAQNLFARHGYSVRTSP